MSKLESDNSRLYTIDIISAIISALSVSPFIKIVDLGKELLFILLYFINYFPIPQYSQIYIYLYF